MEIYVLGASWMRIKAFHFLYGIYPKSRKENKYMGPAINLGMRDVIIKYSII